MLKKIFDDDFILYLKVLAIFSYGNIVAITAIKLEELRPGEYDWLAFPIFLIFYAMYYLFFKYKRNK